MFSNKLLNISNLAENITFNGNAIITDADVWFSTNNDISHKIIKNAGLSVRFNYMNYIYNYPITYSHIYPYDKISDSLNYIFERYFNSEYFVNYKTLKKKHNIFDN